MCFPRDGRGCSSLQTPVLSAGIFKDCLQPEGWDAASSWVIASAGHPAQPAAPALHTRFASGTLPCSAAQNNSENRSRTCALPRYCTQVGQSRTGAQLALVCLWEVTRANPSGTGEDGPEAKPWERNEERGARGGLHPARHSWTEREFIEHSVWRRAAPALPVPSHSAENGRASPPKAGRESLGAAPHCPVPSAPLPLLPTGPSHPR